jgi:hypothetical protein
MKTFTSFRFPEYVMVYVCILVITIFYIPDLMQTLVLYGSYAASHVIQYYSACSL